LILVLAYFKYFSSKKIKFSKENHAYECGPRCLYMIAKYYGLKFSFQEIAKLSNMDEDEGTSIKNLSDAAEKMGFKSMVVSIGFDSANPETPSLQEIPLPGIIHWQGYYFVIIEKITPHGAKIIHPRSGRHTYNKEEFCRFWFQRKNWIQKKEGVVLLLGKNIP